MKTSNNKQEVDAEKYIESTSYLFYANLLLLDTTLISA